MAKKNYRIKDGKIIANISELTEEEIKSVKNYIALGYELAEKGAATKKAKTPTVKEMKTAMKGTEYLTDFETAYKITAKKVEENKAVIDALKTKYGIRTQTKEGKAVVGYFLACQIYGVWKKKQNK